MILFDLCCKNKHVFEVWFPSSENYEEQKKRGLISCPICQSKQVKKALMAPNIGFSKKQNKNTATVIKDKGNSDLSKKIKEFKKFIEKNTENVGKDFAEEARKIYYGEKSSRPIRGETTEEEVKKLEEEGVPFSRIPWSTREDA